MYMQYVYGEKPWIVPQKPSNLFRQYLLRPETPQFGMPAVLKDPPVNASPELGP